ncbi:hypothetical protein ACEN9F_13325 [Duganella sp. CT11-25]|uniref:hypothetical protein n=1 Tax=unclassified Duganella TaxID=2636909 RepID=UPI0039AF444C
MMSIDVIPWWWKLLGAGALLAGLFVAEQAYESHLVKQGDISGYARAKGEWASAESRIKAEAERLASEETKKAREETAALQLKFDQLGDVQQKARIDHENDIRIAVAGVLAGTERLSIPTAAGSGSALPEAGAVESAAAGAGAAPEARVELLPGVSAAIFRFAGEHGQLVRDYNDVLDRFDAVRASCNAD